MVATLSLNVHRGSHARYGRTSCTLMLDDVELATLALPAKWSDARVARYLLAAFISKAAHGLVRDA